MYVVSSEDKFFRISYVHKVHAESCITNCHLNDVSMQTGFGWVK